MKNIILYLIVLYTLILNVNSMGEKECKLKKTGIDCKAKPCFWNDKNIWGDLKVPIRENCDKVIISGSETTPIYLIINENLNLKSLEISTNSHLETSKDLPDQSNNDQFLIDELTITGSSLIFQNININGEIKKLTVRENSQISIKSSTMDFEKIEVVDSEKSKFEILQGSSVKFESENIEETKEQFFKFDIPLDLIDSNLLVIYDQLENNPDCYFNKGINTEGSKSGGVVSIKGNCKLSGDNLEFNNFTISGIGFNIGSNTNLIVYDTFINEHTEPIQVGKNSTILIKKLQPINNIKFDDESSKLIIGIDGENNVDNKVSSEITNIINGVIEFDKLIKGTIKLDSIKYSIILKRVMGNKIYITNSILNSIQTDFGNIKNGSVSKYTLISLDKNIEIMNGLELENTKLIFGNNVKFQINSTSVIKGELSSIDIVGELTISSGSKLSVENNKSINSGASVTLINSTISCFNFTLNNGVLSSIGESHLELSKGIGNLILNDDSSILISNTVSSQGNRLIVNGNFKIYSKDNKLKFNQLGKVSSHLYFTGDCLLNGNLELYFTVLDLYSEYHILKCNSGKYSNQFKNTVLYLNDSKLDQQSYQIEIRDTLYLLSEEAQTEDEVEKTFNAWTLVTALSISAFAVLIISFYLFYKKKFRKQQNNYLPVELMDMEK